MKIRGIIIAFLALMVFFASYACANEPEPQKASTAAPVKVPYTNQTMAEVIKNGYAGTDDVIAYDTREKHRQDDSASREAVVNDDVAVEPTAGPDTGTVEEGETAVSELVDEWNLEGNDDSEGERTGESDESVTESEDPVLTYLGTYTATAYCACPICTGEYSTGYTASGTIATEGRTIACNNLPIGTQVYIEGYGYYTVEDTGWTPYGDAWLDIFYSSHDSALAFGVRNVEVYLVN